MATVRPTTGAAPLEGTPEKAKPAPSVEAVLFNETKESAPTKGIEADVELDAEGNYHIVIPSTMDFGKIGVTENGNTYVGVKADAVTLKFTGKKADGTDHTPKELETYSISFRLGLRMKAK
jgi:hypothetical protein